MPAKYKPSSEQNPMNLPKTNRPSCADLARAAERECAAFFGAVYELLGGDDARIAAEQWLTGFQSIPLPIGSSTEMCRQVTVTAAVCLARHLRQSPPPFVPQTSVEPRMDRYHGPHVSTSAASALMG